MTTVEMLALLFAFTMVGGIAFFLIGDTGLWRVVPGARKPGSTDYDDNTR
ncbi:hypothetical protein [Elioraea sp.]|nr:hypothetical protein [Elioraea sp.]